LLIGILKTLRPKQWTKNGLIFTALIFDLKLFHLLPALNTLAGFIILCFVSGTVYLINDLVDVEKDRQHPIKRYRPIAAGQVSTQAAIITVIALMLICIPISFNLHIYFGFIIVSYLILQIAYSFKLKNVVIIDVLAITAGFVLRVGGGVVLVQAERFSPWLYVFTMFGALFLALGKRRQELLLLKGQASQTRAILNEYNLPFLDEMIAIVTAGTVMTYCFYTFFAPNLPDNHAMMLTIPFVIYGIFRYLYIIHVQGNGGAPDEVFLTDRPLQISILMFGLAVIMILYRF